MEHVKWHIGCSGFSYKEWKEVFYPKGLAQSKWFDYYTQHFTTLELNVTFYRFPTVKMLEGWFHKAPEHFSFSAKVPRTITHYKKLVDTKVMMEEFYATLREGLRDKLGCVLFQLPPSFIYSEEHLQLLLSHINPTFKNAIEFRHESWWRDDVKKRLANQHISFCGVSFPKISFDNAVINTSVAYFRFHGVPVLFYSAYEETFLQKIYTQLQNKKIVKEAFVYFNNTAYLAALTNARYFQQLTHH